MILTICSITEVALGVVSRNVSSASGLSEAKNFSSVNIDLAVNSSNVTLDYDSSDDYYNVVNLTDTLTVQLQHEDEILPSPVLTLPENKTDALSLVLEGGEDYDDAEATNSTSDTSNDSSNLGGMNATSDDNNEEDNHYTDYEEAPKTNLTGNIASPTEYLVQDDVGILDKVQAEVITDNATSARMKINSTDQLDSVAHVNKSQALDQIVALDDDLLEEEYDSQNVTDTLKDGSAMNESVIEPLAYESEDLENETLALNTTDIIPTYVEHGVFKHDLVNPTDPDVYEKIQDSDDKLPSSSFSISSWLTELLLGRNSSETSVFFGEPTDIDTSLNESIQMGQYSSKGHQDNASTSDIYPSNNEVSLSYCLG